MSQRIKFAPNSFFEQLSVSSFSISIRQPVWSSLLGILGSYLLLIIFFYIFSSQDDRGFIGVCIIFWSIFLPISLFRLLYYEKINVDIGGNSLVKRKCFAGINYKVVSLKWPSDAYYLNENVYGSYQRVTHVWLIAKSEGSKQSKRLIKFSSEEQYKSFIQVLRGKFPELQIREWHD